MQRKQTLSVPNLCARLPWEIGEYVRYTRALRFEEPRPQRRSAPGAPPLSPPF